MSVTLTTELKDGTSSAVTVGIKDGLSQQEYEQLVVAAFYRLWDAYKGSKRTQPQLEMVTEMSGIIDESVNPIRGATAGHHQTMIRLDEIAYEIHQTAIAKKFWDLDKLPSMGKVMGKLALVHSEVTEVLEAFRRNKGQTEIVKEMADIVIRVLDIYAACYRWELVSDSLQDAILDKMNENRQRPAMHGHAWG